MRKALPLFPLPLVAWFLTCLYSVDQAEFAYVTEFGRRVAVRDGASDAGLHIKAPWPIHSVQRIDRRLQTFDLPAIESLTRDPENFTVDKSLTVDAYVCWRIPDAEGADRFIRTLGTPAFAQRVLGQRVASQLGAVISNSALDELISVVPVQQTEVRSAALRAKLLSQGSDSLPELVRQSYGIEIVDIRLRRFNYPEAVRPSITERIRSEREKKVVDYQSEGRRRSAEIISVAEREARIIEATARADAERLRAKAEAEADAIRNQAAVLDKDFYTFLQKLRAYRAMLADTRDMLLLSTRHELFDLLLRPPKPLEGK